MATTHRGFTFRSRLEARYALFFDELGLSWQYEPDGFAIDESTRYVPDFRLTGLSTWIEVKPEISDDALDAAALLAKLGGNAFVAIDAPSRMLLLPAARESIRETENLHTWTQCTRCGRLAILPRVLPEQPHLADRGLYGYTTGLHVAAEKADQAMFGRPLDRPYPLIPVGSR